MVGSLKQQVIAKLVSTYIPLLSVLLSIKTLTIYYSLMVEKTSSLFMKIVVALLCLFALKVVDAWFIYLKMASVSNYNSPKGQVMRSTVLRRDHRQAQAGEWNDVWTFPANPINNISGGQNGWSDIRQVCFFNQLTKMYWSIRKAFIIMEFSTSLKKRSVSMGWNGLSDKANMFLWLRLWMNNSCTRSTPPSSTCWCAPGTKRSVFSEIWQRKICSPCRARLCLFHNCCSPFQIRLLWKNDHV